MVRQPEPTISDQEIDLALRERRLGWVREDGHLVMRWQGPDFASAVAFVNQVACLAEQADHHPDIDIRYTRVTLSLTTHESSGLTAKDLLLAEAIDAIAASGESRESPA